METSEVFDMEMAVLEKAVEEQRPVRLFFCTGYQVEVIIESFDFEVIVCRKVGHDKVWLVYRDKLCTIEV